MCNMTWNDLVEMIESMTEEQKNTDATVYLTELDEVFAIKAGIDFADDNNEIAGILDEGHPFIIV